jgi:hypothetical protein
MDFFDAQELLSKTPPTKRAAYSDRTVWLLAEISRLVYEQLPDEVSVKQLVADIRSAIESGKEAGIVEALIGKAGTLQSSEAEIVARELGKANFELVETFVANGTEAILVKLSPSDDFEGMLVLAFRGTQMSLKDIKSDIKANLISAPGGGRVHQGFLEAFQQVEGQIKSGLQKHKGLPVYITGHSLGGALAMLATRYLGTDSTGATYTFGCPRVGDDEFFKKIKTPVYRIVNAADGVARVPFGFILNLILQAIRLVPINGTKLISEWLRKNFSGYTHYGNLVFLSAPANTPDEDGVAFKGLVVKKSPDIFWRLSLVIKRIVLTQGKAMGGDHRMQEYSQKLLAYALRRQRI